VALVAATSAAVASYSPLAPGEQAYTRLVAVAGLSAADLGWSARVAPGFNGQLPTPPPPQQASRSIENFVSGPALSVSEDEIVVRVYERGEVALHLTPTTRIWNDLWVKDVPIEEGDWITAWGPRLADGSHDVELLYANIVNLQGVVLEVRHDEDAVRLTHVDARQGQHEIVIYAERALGAGVELRDGDRLQVVGRKLGDGSVLATTLLGSSPPFAPMPVPNFQPMR
jgi:hypothetical protein